MRHSLFRENQVRAGPFKKSEGMGLLGSAHGEWLPDGVSRRDV